MNSVVINGIKRSVHLDLTFEKNGKEYILFREYLPDGKLGKMIHSTQKSNVLLEEQENEWER